LRSDAIDQLISSYLKQPAKVSWNGAIGDSVRGLFDGGRVELAGVALLALPFDRLVFESDRFAFTPGIPATIQVLRPRVEISIDQRQLDRWLRRARAPFSLSLQEDAIEFQMEVAGFPITRTRTTVDIVDGWASLKPLHAEVFGLRSRLATLFRASLPIPRLAANTRITAVRHAQGAIRVELTLDDFEDRITPGLLDRLQSRFLPFAPSWNVRSPDPDPD
jgi:hypothetical protein